MSNDPAREGPRLAIRDPLPSMGKVRSIAC